MATVITGMTGTHAYPRVLLNIIRDGHKVSPRGRATHELTDVLIALDSSRNAFPYAVRPGLSKKILATEALQLVGRFQDPHMNLWASPNFMQFREPEGHFWGAYGSRIGQQLYDCARKLTQDPNTRQAVITLWSPTKDNVPGKLDYPCTLSITFMIRDGLLNMNVHMRSNDAWLGLPYDLGQFAFLHHTLANVLRMNTGWYTHFVNSLHLYGTNMDAAHQVVAGEYEPRENLDLTGIEPISERLEERVFDVVNKALHLAVGPTSENFQWMNDTERWMCAQTAGYRHMSEDEKAAL